MIINKTDGKQFRGVSRNQIVIACGVDIHGNKYAEIASRGHITSQQCLKPMANTLKKEALSTTMGYFHTTNLYLN